MQHHAAEGDTVRVHYTGMLPDGTILETSHGGEPLEFTLGRGEVIPGLEHAVTGMAPGERKSVWITPDQAYGPHQDDLLLMVDRSRFPDHIQPAPGQRLRMRREGVPPVMVTVVEVDDDEVILDANHPLAGRDLTFDVQLLEVI
ncbi:MAG TPA: peptidylprolyl isomerase [Longimicrobiaceae bacterium]